MCFNQYFLSISDGTQRCSDYNADGFKCAEKCYDTPQDSPLSNNRKANILPYLPKEAICPGELFCCKRTEPL